MGLLSFAEDTEPAQLEDNIKWKERSNEVLPRAPKITKEHAPRKDEGITSLSYDQVNDNADELIELRGAGRYFGVTDPETGDSINAQQSLGPLCDNCHKRGHVRSKCKTVICHKCGVVGDHYETQCPSTIVCARCGERGHIAGNCKSRTRKRQYCKSCDTFNHSDENCPSIWRSYLTISGMVEPKLPVTFCYNCGDDNHYGDECPQQRTSRIPNLDGSAFSGNNLPQGLRSSYFDRLHGRSSRLKLGGSTKNFSQYDLPKKSSNRGNHPTQSSKSKDYQPSRSGFLAAQTNGKRSSIPAKPIQASRSGLVPNKANKKDFKPSRSGMIRQGKKSGSKNMQQWY